VPITRDLVESLIRLPEDSCALCYPDGLTEDLIEHVGQNLETMVPDPHRGPFIRIVDGLEPCERAELIALMFLEREAAATAEDFPAVFDQAQRIHSDADSAYLFAKNDLPHFWRNGMAKLGLE